MIGENLIRIRQSIREVAERCGRSPSAIRLVAVSKKFPRAAVEEAVAAGQLIFGENYIQEAAEKFSQLRFPAQLHFIGHLQSNKAALAADICTMIETVDRVKIARVLHQRLEQNDRQLDVLVQVNVGGEGSKSGVLPENLESLLAALRDLPRLGLRGLMTMPPFTPDPEMARPFFIKLRELAERMRQRGLLGADGTVELSMGMSHDYHVAIEEGATLIRIGTAIFGQRRPPAPGIISKDET